MDGGAWWAAVHGVAKSRTRPSDFFHFSLSCIGEWNGNPCSCLENPRDGKPGGLPSMGSHRVGHDWSDLVAAAAVSKEFLGYLACKEPSSALSCSLSPPLIMWLLNMPRFSLLWISSPTGLLFPTVYTHIHPSGMLTYQVLLLLGVL